GGRQPGQFSKQVRKASGRTMKRSSRNRRLTHPTSSRLARREELLGFSREFKQLFSRRNEADFWGLRVNDKTYSRAWGGTIDGLRPGPIRLVRRDLMLLLLIQLIDVYTIVVLAAVVLTWIRLSPRNPVLQFVHMLTEPVLAPARRIIPPLGGLDISPMLVMIALQAIRSVLVRSF